MLTKNNKHYPKAGFVMIEKFGPSIDLIQLKMETHPC